MLLVDTDILIDILRGHRPALLDALIAACALARSATLLTFNARHYRVVEGLELEQPYTR